MAEKQAFERAVRSRYWREADAKIVVKAWRASGASLAEFARRTRVNEQRLTRWAARLEAPARQAVRFHPVRVSDREPEGASIEIVVAGCRVIVGHEVTTDNLRRVLTAVRESGAC